MRNQINQQKAIAKEEKEAVKAAAKAEKAAGKLAKGIRLAEKKTLPNTVEVSKKAKGRLSIKRRRRVKPRLTLIQMQISIQYSRVVINNKTKEIFYIPNLPPAYTERSKLLTDFIKGLLNSKYFIS